MLKINAKEMGSIVILRLQGEIVRGQTSTLCNAVHALPDVGTVVLDLSGVTAVDAGGLGAMLELRGEMESRGIHFELMNPTQWVSMVLEVSRLNNVFRVTSAAEIFQSVSRSLGATHAALAPCA